MRHNPPAILFLSGASGVGKTTLVSLLEQRARSAATVFLHSDSAGVPSFAEMVREAGSLEKWQERRTHWWIRRIASEYENGEVVVMEGQSNLDFIEAGCREAGLLRYAIVLIDCDWETMADRLAQDRSQPELASQAMFRWARFLRAQAQSKHVPIINTSHLKIEEAAQVLEGLVQELAARDADPLSAPTLNPG